MNSLYILEIDKFALTNEEIYLETYSKVQSNTLMNSTQSKQSLFEQEALPHMNALYSFAVRLCRDRDDASDLLQETFLKGYRFFDKFETGTNCKAWLFRILKNTYINQYRKDKKEPDTIEYDTIEEFYDLIRSESSESTDLQKRIFDNLLDDEISIALDSLPESFRTAIILCDLEGMTYDEISEILECPIGTVRSRLHRARNILASKLIKYAKNRGYDTQQYE
ncbi:MAG: sigma-70 family RNA polymerase sigma factor [Bacteroidota bacterium]